MTRGGGERLADLNPFIGMGPCCDMHGRNCEPPSELCCRWCTEVTHPDHRDGTTCAVPDLSGNPQMALELARFIRRLAEPAE